MTIETFSSLETAWTKEQFLTYGLSIATSLGLPVTSWRVGDPTRTLFEFLAEVLATRDEYASELAKAALLSTATGEWLTIVAREQYGIERVAATYATPTVTLANVGGGRYEYEAGDIVVQDSSSGVNYRNTADGVIDGAGSVTLDFVCETAGSDGSVGANYIDTLVSPVWADITVTASTASIGVDEQSDYELRLQCTASLGALSPNGPSDAYEYVARNSALTGRTDVTMARAFGDNATGTVTVYIAGPDGAVSGAAVAAVQTAVEQWATPLCITPTVVSASETPVNVTATITATDVPSGLGDSAEVAVSALIAAVGIGRPVTLAALIHTIYAHAESLGCASISVALSAPAADVSIADSAIAVPGMLTITATEAT